jgi:hypothetical protein
VSPAFAQGHIDICALHVDLSPVSAAAVDMKGGAAPADVDFGLYPMSVLGIQNTLRREGAAIDDSSDRSALTTGPLACVVDSIRSWERAYPADPWIAKDLLSLEVVYLRAHHAAARELAASTEAWLEHDYPQSNYVEPARLALGDIRASEVRHQDVLASAPHVVATALREAPASILAFVPPPIALAAADVPPPVALASLFPEIKMLSSVWERFAPLVTDRH